MQNAETVLNIIRSDQPSRIGVTGEPRDTEMVMRGSGEGRWKRTLLYLAGGLSYGLSGLEQGKGREALPIATIWKE